MAMVWPSGVWCGVVMWCGVMCMEGKEEGVERMKRYAFKD